MKRKIFLGVCLALVTALTVSCGGMDTIQFDHGEATYLIPINTSYSDNYGYYDYKAKKFITDSSIHHACRFSDGWGLVITHDKKYRFMDKDGKFAPGVYEDATSYHDMLAWVLTEGDPHFKAIDINGKVEFTLEDTNITEVKIFSEGLAAVCFKQPNGDEKWGMVDTEGKLVIPATFDYIDVFSEGLCFVKKDYARGYIDNTGKFVIQPTTKYYWVDRFVNGRAMVGGSWHEDWGAIDMQGNVVVPLKYDYRVVHRDGGNIRVGSKTDDKGNRIHPNFDLVDIGDITRVEYAIEPFNKADYAAVWVGEKFGNKRIMGGYIDREGNFIYGPYKDIDIMGGGALSTVWLWSAKRKESRL